MVLRAPSEDPDKGYGPPKIVVLRDDEGVERSVWLIHHLLREQFRSARPSSGDRVAVKYLGLHACGYHSYRVAVDRENSTVDWGPTSATGGIEDRPPPEEDEDDGVPF